MSKRTRVGVIGCGFFSRNHFHSWQSLAAKGVDLVAVCDLDGEKAQTIAAEFGIANWYTDAETMLAEQALDLVDIVTQVGSHRPLAEMTIAAGVGTIVQKPFAPTIDDCRAIVEAADKNGVFLAVHENFRFQSPNLAALDAIKSGKIGEPTWARISFRTDHDIYTGQPYLREEERFVLTDIGTHVLDLARFFMGEVEHLSAEVQKRNTEIRGEDTATIVLRHTSGAVSVVDCSYSAHRIPDAFPETIVDIEGTKGTVSVRQGYDIDISADGRLATSSSESKVLPWAEKPWHVVQESVFNTCAHLLERFVAGEHADISGGDNLKTFALVEAAYEAAASGQSVKPEA
jgi:predicted dehydrogenase